MPRHACVRTAGRYRHFVANLSVTPDQRSGDVILLANYCGPARDEETGWYFGTAHWGWHGSLCDTDMLIPIVLSYPSGEGAALQRFLDRAQNELNADHRITAVASIVHKLLTGEDTP